MAKEYRIKEIITYETDSSGYINVEFRIIGDLKNKVRLLESNDYVDWVESLESNRRYGSDWGSDVFDDDFQNPYSGFDFYDWKEEFEDESMIKKYIYDNYSINDLPDLE
jgi:hypothetical protein